MSNRPVFRGDSIDLRDLEAYEQELREWEVVCKREALLEDIALVKAAEEKLAKERVMLVKNHGATILFGSGVPDSSHGVDGQGWLDWETLDVFLKVNGQWELINSLASEASAGPSGAPGDDGQDGQDGQDGLDGNDWRVSAGAPSIIAGDEEGDLYLDTSNGDVYQVQSAAWVLVDNITGPTGSTGPPGADGADGADGIDGNDWRVAAGAPSIIAGDEEGDMYLNTTNGDVYQVQAGVWVLTANITGPGTVPGFFNTYGPPTPQALTFLSGHNLDLDTTRITSGDFSRTAAGRVKLIGLEGVFEVTYSVVVEETSGTFANLFTWLEVNTGAGFAELVATRTSVVVPGSGKIQTNLTIIMSIATNDLFFLVAGKSGAGTLQVITDQSSLTFTRLSDAVLP